MFAQRGYANASRFSNFRGQPLDENSLRQLAPSVFATQPWAEVSERYRFIPTIDVIRALGEHGFLPVKAQQGHCRTEGKQEYTKHLVRFRQAENRELHVGSEVFEIVLLNSHDRTTGYQLHAGIFRIACLNGLIVSSSDFGTVRARHSGRADIAGQVIEASYEIIKEAPKVFAQIDAWKQIKLERPQQLALAAAALELRDSEAKIEPAELIEPKRSADTGKDLWTTTNVIQEKLIRGGARAVGTTGRRFTTRAVGAPGEDVKLNRALWRLTEELAKVAA